MSQIVIDPCRESVHIVFQNSTGSVLFDQIYYETGEYALPARQLAVKLSARIVHHNYSMELSVSGL